MDFSPRACRTNNIDPEYESTTTLSVLGAVFFCFRVGASLMRRCRRQYEVRAGGIRDTKGPTDVAP
jgi:hypothetical protein